MLVRSLLIAIVVSASWALRVQSLAAQTAVQPEPTLVRVTYPVADLVIPIEDYSAFTDRKPAKDAKKTADELATTLQKLITNTIAKKSWESAGGNGTIQYFPTGNAIIVNQTNAVHAELAQLLDSLRKLQDVEVSVQVRFLEVAPKTAERVQGMMKQHGQPLRDGAVAVEDKQFLLLLEMVQADRDGVIRQMPKVTLFNGQKAGVSAKVDNVGVRFDVSSIMSADRKTVRLWLDFENAMKTNRAIRVGETFNVPADRVLVWHAGQVGGTHVFVTARPCLVQPEKEQLFLGQILPIPGR
jgi:hypothetical protein